jgi:thiamine biosynthesis lipoprotein
LAPTCLVAGIYATSVFVLGRRDGLQFAESATGVEACVQDEQDIFRTQFFSQHQVQAA